MHENLRNGSDEMYKPNKTKTMNTIKTLAIALGLSLAAQVNAQDIASVSLIDHPDYLGKITTTTNSEIVKVYVGNIKNERLAFTLKDEAGNVLFSRSITKKEPQAYLKMDLSALKDGNYQMLLGDSKTQVSKTLRKSSTALVTKPTTSLVALN